MKARKTFMKIGGFVLAVVGLFVVIGNSIPQRASYPPRALSAETFAKLSPDEILAQGRELFGAGGPLRAGLPTAERERALASLLVERAGRAIAVRRDLAAAYFVRGLGRYLLDPDDVVTVRADIRQALGLEPYDDFYAAAAQFLHAIPRPAQPRAD